MSIKSSIVQWKDKRKLYYTYKRLADELILAEIAESRENSFLQLLKDEYIKKKIYENYSNTQDDELRECIDYCLANGENMFCYSEAQKSYYDINDVYYDENVGLFYGFWRGKKLYLKKSFSDAEAVRAYLSNSIWEQSEKSPHCYQDNDFSINDGDVILDIGGAEGNFTLSLIDRVSKSYIFECDPEWVEALKVTFKDYLDKVEIIPLYVSDKDTKKEISLDKFFKDRGLSKVGMVKMDIEGAEISVLKGAAKTISSKYVDKWAVCTYHRIADAENIWNLLPDYNKKYTKGYIMSTPWRLYDLEEPYWVHGVLRANV